MRTAVPIALLLLVAVAGAEERSLESRVNEAIDRGAANLLSHQATDGSWNKDDKVHPLGRTALCAFALLHAGYGRDHHSIERALAFLDIKPGFEPHSTYEAGVILLLLNALGSEYRGRIHEICDWLLSHYDEGRRLWGYPDGVHDLSNTQYAVFGLKVGALHGYKIPRDFWRSVSEGVLRLQARDGGFRYRPGSIASGSMTHAGLLVLLFANQELGLKRPPREVKSAMDRAHKWYEEHYRVDHLPVGHGWSKAHYYYYMYGLERYGQFFKRKTIAGHDWYREGAEELLGLQKDGGEWGRLEETAFAILFLRKVTFTAPKARRIGEPAAVKTAKKPPEPGPPRPDKDVPCLRRWLVAGPFFSAKHEDDMLFEAHFKLSRARPGPGVRAGKKKWLAYESPEDGIDLQLAAGKGAFCSYYAAQYLFADEATKALLWLGTDDGFRVYLNGEQVGASLHHGYLGDDAATVPLELRAGRNLLIIKVSNAEHYAKLRARLTDANRANPATIRASLRRKE
jgi:hypothetical protein